MSNKILKECSTQKGLTIIVGIIMGLVLRNAVVAIALIITALLGDKIRMYDNGIVELERFGGLKSNSIKKINLTEVKVRRRLFGAKVFLYLENEKYVISGLSHDDADEIESILCLD